MLGGCDDPDDDLRPEGLLAEEYKDPERYVAEEGEYEDYDRGLVVSAQAAWVTALKERAEVSRDLLRQRRMNPINETHDTTGWPA